MAYLDPDAYENATKQWYPDGFEKPAMVESAFYAWVPKMDGWGKRTGGGKWQINPLIDYGTGSSDFTTALEVQSNPDYPMFEVTRRKNFHIFGISGELLEVGRSQAGVIEDSLKHRTDSGVEEFGVASAIHLWGNGGGALGIIASTTTLASQTVVLSDSNDAFKFRKGMRLALSDDDGTGGAGIRTGGQKYMTVDSVTDTGFVIVEATIDTAITDAVLLDYIFRKGDYNNVIHGIKGWIPQDVTAAAWFGQDRTDDEIRLAGYRYLGHGRPFEEEIGKAIALGGRYGGRYTHAFANTLRVAEVMAAMEARGRVKFEVKSFKGRPVNANLEVGFTGLVFPTPRGPITLVGDDYCPYGDVIVTRKEAWEFVSAGPWPHFERGETKKILHLSPTADGQQARLKGYGNLGCRRPVDCILYRPDATS